jgi:hypothetical protein
MTDLLTEERIARALKTVAGATVPDGRVPDFSRVACWGHLSVEDLDGDGAATWTGSPRRRRLGRSLGALVAVLALGGAGTGIAAATGAFSTEGMKLIAPAIGRILPTGRWIAANVTTRLSEEGPDGSTLTLETASADAAGGCMRLVVSAPGAALNDGYVACGGTYSTLHPPTTHTPTTTNFGTGATRSWTSPNGTRWTFVYGRSNTSRATKVAAVSKAGMVLATAPISNGWFILSVETASSATQQTAGRHLVYYGPTGRQTGEYPTL